MEQTMEYGIWGREQIDPKSFDQMNAAMSIAPAVAGAIMPDAHVGYGLPIGGVLALDNAVCPYAVGVDIACRMKLSILPIDPADLTSNKQQFIDALNRRVYFGVGVETPKDRPYDHPVLYHDAWKSIDVLRENMESGKATKQLGTSGSGNHFVEFGVLEVSELNVAQLASASALGAEGRRFESCRSDLSAGAYVAVMSHSGSRGTGAAVCTKYSRLAKSLHTELADDPLTRDLGWLELDTDAGREYWLAMSVMGDYAKANHDCIHTAIAEFLGVTPLMQIENHHNFAWKETHGGREVIVHRKGATPAGDGVLGVIPGSMGTAAYVVRGKGNPESLHSASHGAGRLMSRKQAKATFNYREAVDLLATRGITVLSAGADEVCGVYKNIDEVMAAQSDLVEAVAKFSPVIVKMCGSGDRAED